MLTEKQFCHICGCYQNFKKDEIYKGRGRRSHCKKCGTESDGDKFDREHFEWVGGKVGWLSCFLENNRNPARRIKRRPTISLERPPGLFWTE